MNTFQPLFQKEVSRKEFLTIAGFGIASIFGLSTLIKLLTGRSTSSYTKRSVSDYSGNAYGGKKPTSKL